MNFWFVVLKKKKLLQFALEILMVSIDQFNRKCELKYLRFYVSMIELNCVSKKEMI